MKNLEKNNTNPILKGDLEEADYKEQLLSEYENNPYIEALPQIFSEDYVMDHFFSIPKITKHDKLKESFIRYHVLKRVKNFIQPLPIHFEIERRLSTLIRRGYLARNPLDKEFLERIRIINELKEDEEKSISKIYDRMNYIRSTADSLSIIGISGIGKTTAIERLLLMYPQVIKHTEYKGQSFNRTQIVWLKIDCPFDGSLSTLCKSFFKAIDDLLGTRYLEKHGYLNRVTSTMLLHMTSLASMYGIGTLIIDEIQNLLHAKNEQEEMLDFFVTLSNTVGIPTVMIGTSKAQKLFNGNFRQARRAASDGAIIWDRMHKDDEEWQFFLETLWDLQCLKNYSELTDEVKEVFYEECQGITAIAVNLFILAQERALFDEDNQDEIISAKVLKRTAKEDMQMIQPMIKAVRNNKLSDIMKYEDIIINLDDIMLNLKNDTEMAGRIKNAFSERQKTLEYKRKDKIENLCVELHAIGVFDCLHQKDIEKLAKTIVEKNPFDTEFNTLKLEAIQQAIELNEQKKVQKNKIKPNTNLLPLLAIRKKAFDKKEDPYVLLKEQGYIKNPLEEFY